MKPNQRPARWIWLFVFLPLSGCEMVQNLPYVGKGLPDAESRAIGAGCRHAGRAIEDCYAINPRASRSGVFAGWRDMNDYMTTGKIPEIKPLVAANTPPPPEPVAKAPVEKDHDTSHDDEEDHDDVADAKKGKSGQADDHGKVADKSSDKGSEKLAVKGNGKDGKVADKSGKSAGKDGGKGLAKGGKPYDEEDAHSADKPTEKASAKYVTSVDRPPPTPKTTPRPRWEPGKKDKDGEEPKVWERKPRT